jgi:hypothetical protein
MIGASGWWIVGKRPPSTKKLLGGGGLGGKCVCVKRSQLVQNLEWYFLALVHVRKAVESSLRKGALMMFSETYIFGA